MDLLHALESSGSHSFQSLIGLSIIFACAIIFYVSFFVFCKRSVFPRIVGRPKKAFLRFLLAEVVAAFIIMGLEIVPYFFTSSQRVFGLSAGPIEEVGKLLPVIWIASRNKFFREYLKDYGWFYVGLVAGFAFGFFEFVMYSLSFLATTSFETAVIAIVFGRFSVMGLHALWTMFTVWAYSRWLKARDDGGSWWIGVLGVFGAITAHSLYDFLVYSSYTTGNGIYILAGSIVYIVMLAIFFMSWIKTKKYYQKSSPGKDWLFRVFIIPKTSPTRR